MELVNETQWQYNSELSYEANNFLQLKKLIYSLFIVKKNNKKEISNFKKIGKNIPSQSSNARK